VSERKIVARIIEKRTRLVESYHALLEMDLGSRESYSRVISASASLPCMHLRRAANFHASQNH